MYMYDQRQLPKFFRPGDQVLLRLQRSYDVLTTEAFGKLYPKLLFAVIRGISKPALLYDSLGCHRSMMQMQRSLYILLRLGTATGNTYTPSMPNKFGC